MIDLDARITAIPDGVLSTGSGRRVRLSLFLTPLPGNDLEKLPRIVSDWMNDTGRRLHIWHDQQFAGAGTPVPAVTPLPNWPNPAALDKAQELWTRIFSTMPDGANGFGTLRTLLADARVAPSARPDDPLKDAAYIFASRSALHSHLDTLKLAHLNLHNRALLGLGDKDLEPDNLAARALRLRPYRDPLRAHKQDLARALVPSDIRASAIGRVTAMRRLLDSQSNPSRHAEGEADTTLSSVKQKLIENYRAYSTGRHREGHLSHLELIRGQADDFVNTVTRSADTGSPIHVGLGWDSYDEVAKLFLHHLAAHDLANPAEAASPREARNASDAASDAVSRKFSAIRAFPTLAKFLGLIVDVEFEAPLTWDTASKPYIAAEFVADGGSPTPFAQLDRTAFHFEKAAGLFVVRHRDDADTTTSFDEIKIDNGVVRLGDGGGLPEKTASRSGRPIRICCCGHCFSRRRRMNKQERPAACRPVPQPACRKH